jgi:hypothetical protein
MKLQSRVAFTASLSDPWRSKVRLIVVLLVGIASAGLMAVSVTMNFAFGSSFGRTALESYAYGAAFGFADILKVVAPIVAAGTFAKRKWGATFLALLLWGTFTVCSAVSAIGLCIGQSSLHGGRSEGSGRPEPEAFWQAWKRINPSYDVSGSSLPPQVWPGANACS